MKRSLVAAFLFVAASALAVAVATPGAVDNAGRWVKGGLFIGNAGISGSRAHAITTTRVVDVDHDFASSTTTCTDTPAVTATGVLKGDPCMVGVGPRDGGVQIVTDNSAFLCFSDADNTAKLRHCAVGTAANPADAGYTLRFLSSK